jgi:hypothetical protein
MTRYSLVRSYVSKKYIASIFRVGVITHKITIQIFTAVKTSNLTSHLVLNVTNNFSVSSRSKCINESCCLRILGCFLLYDKKATNNRSTRNFAPITDRPLYTENNGHRSSSKTQPVRIPNNKEYPVRY